MKTLNDALAALSKVAVELHNVADRETRALKKLGELGYDLSNENLTFPDEQKSHAQMVITAVAMIDKHMNREVIHNRRLLNAIEVNLEHLDRIEALDAEIAELKDRLQNRERAHDALFDDWKKLQAAVGDDVCTNEGVTDAAVLLIGELRSLRSALRERDAERKRKLAVLRGEHDPTRGGG